MLCMCFHQRLGFSLHPIDRKAPHLQQKHSHLRHTASTTQLLTSQPHLVSRSTAASPLLSARHTRQ